MHRHLYIQGVQIEEVECHKHLRVYLSTGCSWHQHILYLKEKAWCRINIMEKLKLKLDRKPLETIYIAFIRPLLENADVVWDNCSHYEKNELEKVQIEAARISTGATKFIFINNLYKEISWNKLQKRRDDHKLTLFYKIYNNLTPNYLFLLIPQQVEKILGMHKTSETSEPEQACKVMILFFLPSTLRQWNNLSIETRQLYSSNSLKCFLKKRTNSLYLNTTTLKKEKHRYMYFNTPTYGMQLTKS